MKKNLFISAETLLIDSFKLGKQIYDSDFRPDFIVGLWRGGTPVGIAVQEYLAYKGIKTDHIAIRTSAYEGIGKMSRKIKVHGLDYIIKNANAKDNLLFVDDVYETGLSMEAALIQLMRKARKNTPQDIRIAVAYYKPARNKTERKPDFYIHETNQWLVFPHELMNLTLEEIAEGKGKEITDLLECRS